VEQIRHRFPFGSKVPWYAGKEPLTAQERAVVTARWLEVFNQVVDPCFIWRCDEPVRGHRNPHSALTWARANNLTIKGHSLLYTPFHPSWFEQITDSAERWRLAELHTRSVVSRYDGVVTTWDVVNEPLHTTALGDARNAFAPLGTVPMEQVTEYAERALRWARDSSSNAILLLNDFELENGPALDRMETLLRELRRRNAPFDGVGIQAHWPIGYPVSLSQLWERINRLGQYGRVFLTEASVPSAPAPADLPAWMREQWWSGWTEERQADYLTKLYSLGFGSPFVDGIVYWDQHERDAYIPTGGLLRLDLTPRPAFEALRKLIRDEWWTHWEGQADDAGIVALRAFFGDHRVIVTLPGGRMAMASVSVSRDGELLIVNLPVSPAVNSADAMTEVPSPALEEDESPKEQTTATPE
jgi:hypothetical protein